LKKTLWLLLLGIALLGVALALPSAKQVVREGDAISVDYVLTLEDGTVYYSSIGNEPLNATLGQGQLIPGFEEQMIGMRVGETRTFTLPPEKAYGNYLPEMVGTFDRNRLPEGVEPEIGKQIQANLKDGTQTVAIITPFTNTTITLDANHPLAGQTLTFQIKLLKIDENPALHSQSFTNAGWIVFILGVLAVGFAIFYHKNALSSVGSRRSVRPRLVR